MRTFVGTTLYAITQWDLIAAFANRASMMQVGMGQIALVRNCTMVISWECLQGHTTYVKYKDRVLSTVHHLTSYTIRRKECDFAIKTERSLRTRVSEHKRL